MTMMRLSDAKMMQLVRNHNAILNHPFGASDDLYAHCILGPYHMGLLGEESEVLTRGSVTRVCIHSASDNTL